MKKKTGFALVSAVVISAFLMVAIVGISTVLVSQLRAQSQTGLSRKALYYAEAALQNSFVAARDSTDTTGIYGVLNGTSGATYNSFSNPGPSYKRTDDVVSKIASTDTQSFTWVKAKALVTTTGQGSNQVTVVQGYKFTAIGVVCSKDVTTGLSNTDLENLAVGTTYPSGYSVLARRVVQLSALTLTTNRGPSLNHYGIFAGSGIVQTGSSTYTVVGGTSSDPLRVYAGGSVVMKQTSFTGCPVTVAAHGTVQIKGGASTVPHSAPLMMPPIDFFTWQMKFKEFLSGALPYDGSDPSRMNTSDPNVRTAIGKCLTGKAVGTVGPSGYLYTTPSEVAALWAALSSPTQPGSGPFSLSGGRISAGQYAQLHSTFLTTVFYVQDGSETLDASVPAGEYSGVLVCPGTLTFAGNSVLNSTGAVFMCEGDLIFTGAGYFTGSFYTEGSFVHKGSTKGFLGSIAAATGDVDLRGSASITLKNFGLSIADMDTAFKVDVALGSGWAEGDVSTFKGF